MAEDVYLIFSANKSGEYFGYARMGSAIDADSTPVVATKPIEHEPPTISAPTTADVPLTIPTASTATAPRGHVIDDSARGTIFWEAESESLAPLGTVEGTESHSGETSGEETGQKSPGTQQSAFGKPFKISWLSTERLPFYRTRGLRNPWNANREVKIARDGTEIEPSVGRKLIGLFHQQAQINTLPRGMAPQQQYVPSQQQQSYNAMGMMPLPGHEYTQQTDPYGRSF